MVALVSKDGSSEVAPALSELRSDLTLLEFGVGVDPWPRHAQLAAAAPIDVIVDLVSRPAARFGRLRDLHYFLRPGGRMILRDVVPRPAADNAEARAEFWETLELIRGAVSAGVTDADLDGPPAARDPFRVAEATTSMEYVGDHAVLTRNDVPALPKMNEPAMNAYLESVPDSPHELVRVIPGETFTSRCTLRQNAGHRTVHEVPVEIEAPDVSLRDYRNVVVQPGQVVADDRLILPDTFRHNARPRLVNRYLTERAPRFASLTYATDSLPVLEGAYVHLDNEVHGHFGHIMTEQVSRLWAWPEVKKAVPEAKVLLGARKGREIRSWEYLILEAAGVAREDVVAISRPMRVERLLSPSPMLSNPDYVHPAIADTWLRIGDALAATETPRELPRRFFCTRRIPKRGCRNTEEVEALFKAQGFEIVLPETLPLGVQVQLFRQAEVVAGYAGSGLFQLAFTPTPKPVVTISHDRYSAVNEYLMASVLGHRIDQVTSLPDEDDFQSTFTFDHDREGRWLAEVFDSLP